MTEAATLVIFDTCMT